MKVKVFVNWSIEEVMSDTEVLDYIVTCADDYSKQDDYLEEWLCNNYTMIDLWHLSDEVRAEAEEDFRKYCYEIAEKDFEREWVAREIEI